MNKKAEAGEMLMIFTFIFILIMIGLGILAGTYRFFGSEYDFRQVDANILNYKISKCIQENDIDWKKEFNICGINESVALENSMSFKICLNSEDCAIETSDEKNLLQIGGNFQTCSFTGTKGNSAFPLCAKNLVIKGNDRYEIISGSNQHSRKRSVN